MITTTKIFIVVFLILYYNKSPKVCGHTPKFNTISGVSRGVLWVLKHPAHADPEKKRRGEKKKKKERKERKKERKGEREGKEANDNEKYLSPSLPPLNGFKVSRHGPIRQTR